MCQTAPAPNIVENRGRPTRGPITISIEVSIEASMDAVTVIGPTDSDTRIFPTTRMIHWSQTTRAMRTLTHLNLARPSGPGFSSHLRSLR